MFGEDINNYHLRTVMRETKSTVVHLAQYKQNGQFLVIKRSKEPSPTEFQLTQNEIAVMRQLNHPNILKLESAFVHGLDIYLVHRCMKFGSCKDVMDRFLIVGFPENVASIIARDVLLAIDYLHKRGYVHRSIRASHILLDDIAVLTGFKEAVNMIQNGKRVRQLYSLAESPKELIWAAPEVLEQNLCGYTEKSDIYSFGITMCELGNNITPFQEMGNTLMLTEKLKGNQPSLLDCSTYAVDTTLEEDGANADGDMVNCFATRKIYANRKLSDPFHNFVEICLQRDPNARPSADKLLGHPFIKQSKYTNLRQELGEELKIDTLNAIFNIPDSELSAMIDNMQNVAINNITDFEWNF
ncbi:STE20-related kinase adapter protein alpha [Culicoides brevitarsis]|uniref:STE20-related kinase adapter protein alpha n=1 Tax=Culicoides brevitarsis TaxID=469753 RepID=UPI00307C08E8